MAEIKPNQKQQDEENVNTKITKWRMALGLFSRSEMDIHK